MHYNACNYLSMLGLKLNHVSKRGHRCILRGHFINKKESGDEAIDQYLSKLKIKSEVRTRCCWFRTWTHLHARFNVMKLSRQILISDATRESEYGKLHRYFHIGEIHHLYIYSWSCKLCQSATVALLIHVIHFVHLKRCTISFLITFHLTN